MAYKDYSEDAVTQVKIVIAGGFGVGKTTFVGAVSEIEPLTTEAGMTEASRGVDDLRRTPGKDTTTLALDFGRLSVQSDLVLYLFGTPGQPRFGFMWDELIRGAAGAIVLADTRRLTDCFASLEFVEKQAVPFLVGINVFDDAHHYDPGELRAALRLDARVPVVTCDARRPRSAATVLRALVRQALDTLPHTPRETTDVA